MAARVERSPTTTASACGSAARTASARASLLAWSKTRWPSSARRRPVINPSPPDEPVTKIFAILSFIVSGLTGGPCRTSQSQHALKGLSTNKTRTSLRLITATRPCEGDQGSQTPSFPPCPPFPPCQPLPLYLTISNILYPQHQLLLRLLPPPCPALRSLFNLPKFILHHCRFVLQPANHPLQLTTNSR